MTYMSSLVQMLAFSALGSVVACATGSQAVRSGNAGSPDAPVFAAAASWVVQQESLSVRIDPRPLLIIPEWDGEISVVPTVDPEVIRRRTQVLSRLRIPITDGMQAAACIGTGGLRVDSPGPLTGSCAALDEHRAVLISLPGPQNRDGGAQIVRVVIISNSGFEAYDLTATTVDDRIWTIARAEEVFYVRS